MITRKYKLFLGILMILALLAGPSLAAGLEQVRFLKVSPQDHRAVIQTPDGRLVLVGEGDIVAEDARIVEITEGRVVLERRDEQGPETVIVRLDGRHQRTERLRKALKPAPTMAVPGNQ